MPQLDKLAYMSEVIYIILGFIFIYIILLKYSLNKIYKVLFFRKKILNKSKLNTINLLKIIFYEKYYYIDIFNKVNKNKLFLFKLQNDILNRVLNYIKEEEVIVINSNYSSKLERFLNVEYKDLEKKKLEEYTSIAL